MIVAAFLIKSSSEQLKYRCFVSIVLRFWRRYLEALFKNTEETCQYIIHFCQNAKKTATYNAYS